VSRRWAADIQENGMPELNATTRTFGATSTTDEVLEGVSLSGRRVMVTGVSAGLGVETARGLSLTAPMLWALRVT
jgi:hypothetical protein